MRIIVPHNSDYTWAVHGRPLLFMVSQIGPIALFILLVDSFGPPRDNNYSTVVFAVKNDRFGFKNPALQLVYDDMPSATASAAV